MKEKEKEWEEKAPVPLDPPILGVRTKQLSHTWEDQKNYFCVSPINDLYFMTLGKAIIIKSFLFCILNSAFLILQLPPIEY
jgi:hypothetical protein